MRRIAVLCAAVLLAALTAPAQGERLTRYRQFELGMSAAQASAAVGEASRMVPKKVTVRPALIEEMDWQPRLAVLNESVQSAAVKNVNLLFLEGRLFQVQVSYSGWHVEGLTERDLIDAVALQYGAPTMPTEETLYHLSSGEIGRLLAHWNGANHEGRLLRIGVNSGYVLVLLSKAEYARAGQVRDEARALDVAESSGVSVSLQKELDREMREQREKARVANKASFRP